MRKPYLEHTVYVEYMMGAVAAFATRASRFLEAVVFAQHVLGLDTDGAFTPQVMGLQHKA